MNKQNKKLPPFLKPFIWSYDLKKMDLEKDQKIIITNVLNYGTKEATDWLFRIYPKNKIIQTLKKPLPGAWNRKSINFWSAVLGQGPGKIDRAIK